MNINVLYYSYTMYYNISEHNKSGKINTVRLAKGLLMNSYNSFLFFLISFPPYVTMLPPTAAIKNTNIYLFVTQLASVKQKKGLTDVRECN